MYFIKVCAALTMVFVVGCKTTKNTSAAKAAPVKSVTKTDAGVAAAVDIIMDD